MSLSTMSYKIETNGFAGPLYKLLELIEEKKYEVTEVNLAKITGDFLEYLKVVEDKEPRLLVDFISVAAKLILIKSKSLVPDFALTPEEEEGIKELQSRLNLYKALKVAEENFLTLWSANKISFTKDVFPLESNPVFIAPLEIDCASLLDTLRKTQSSIVALKTQYEKYEAVNFESYVSELISRINQNISRFDSVAKNRNKKEVIILFLALLHLLKDNKIFVDQKSAFSEIMITTKQQ